MAAWAAAAIRFALLQTQQVWSVRDPRGVQLEQVEIHLACSTAPRAHPGAGTGAMGAPHFARPPRAAALSGGVLGASWAQGPARSALERPAYCCLLPIIHPPPHRRRLRRLLRRLLV